MFALWLKRPQRLFLSASGHRLLTKSDICSVDVPFGEQNGNSD